MGPEATGGRAGGSPSRGAIMLSALVFPGVGQLVQKRWLAGVAFALAFLVAGILFAVYAGGIIVSYYRFVDPYYEPAGAPPLKAMLGALGVALLIYMASLADVVLARWRIARRRRIEALGDS